MRFLLYKNPGETPLTALKRLRYLAQISSDIPLTYAGRLDPLAEGLLIVLGGEECKKKEQFLAVDKVYECTVLLGFATDTGDVLGLLTASGPAGFFPPEKIQPVLTACLGSQSQTYPLYSSKTVDGIPLYTLARAGQVSREHIPARMVTIHAIDLINTATIQKEELLNQILQKVHSVSGDFRQKEIIDVWQKELGVQSAQTYQLLNLRVSASSGTYVRVLAEKIGQSLGLLALAFHIRRTEIGEYTLADLDQKPFCAIPNTPAVLK